MKNNKIPIRTVPKSNRKTTKCHTVRRVPIEKQQNTTLSGQFQYKNNIIPHFQDSSNRKITKYHTVRTVPIEKQQNTTLSGQF
jgi:hypothetical protein